MRIALLILIIFCGITESFCQAWNPRKFNYSEWQKQGYKFLNEKEYRKAAEVFTEIIRRDKQSSGNYFARARAYYHCSDFGGAISDMNLHIGLKLKEYDKKLSTDYKFSLTQVDNLADSYLWRGIIRNELKDYSEAIKDFSRSIEIQPNLIPAYLYRGIAFYRSGKYNDALIDFDKVIGLSPDNFDAYKLRIDTKYKLKQYQECIIDCNVLVEKNPDELMTYFVRGCSLFELGEKERACDDWKKASVMGFKKAEDRLNTDCH
jgi:tetratricopeptide (TPR) repeat protein